MTGRSVNDQPITTGDAEADQTIVQHLHTPDMWSSQSGDAIQGEKCACPPCLSPRNGIEKS